jgi:hypothetical protein
MIVKAYAWLFKIINPGLFAIAGDSKSIIHQSMLPSARRPCVYSTNID